MNTFFLQACNRPVVNLRAGEQVYYEWAATCVTFLVRANTQVIFIQIGSLP